MEEKDLLEVITKLRVAKQELRTIDAKEELPLKEDGQKNELVKDVLAMANNTVRSFLVIGLKDGTFDDAGVLQHHYNKNTLNQILAGKIDPPVVVDYQEFVIGSNEYGLIEIVGNNPPYLVARDLVPKITDSKKTRLDKGTILVRHGDRTEGISRAELEELLHGPGLKKAFKDETEKAQHLALEQPPTWEYQLTVELQRSKLEAIKRQISDLKRGLVYKKANHIPGMSFFDWTQARIADLLALLEVTGVIINEEIPASWGPLGKPGDALEIKHAVDKLINVCKDLLEWESEVRAAIPATPFVTLKQKIEGWGMELLDEIVDGCGKLAAIFEHHNPTGQFEITFVFKEPSNLTEVLSEMEELRKQVPGKWIEFL